MDEKATSYLVELGHAQNDTRYEFMRRMRAGEITNYEPYLQNPKTYINYLIVMAIENVQTEALATLHEPLVMKELIANGTAKDHYPTWAKEDTRDIQYTLAIHGYCSDILIHSKYRGVRLQVAKNYPEYTELMMDYAGDMARDEWYAIHELLMSQNHPELRLLKRFLKYKKPSGSNRRILKSKYKAVLTQPNVIEKTMTDYQLFQVGNVLWKRNVAGCGIHCIQYAKKKLPEGMTLTEEDFDHLKGMDNTWDVDNYMTKYDEPIECVSGI